MKGKDIINEKRMDVRYDITVPVLAWRCKVFTQCGAEQGVVMSYLREVPGGTEID